MFLKQQQIIYAVYEKKKMATNSVQSLEPHCPFATHNKNIPNFIANALDLFSKSNIKKNIYYFFLSNLRICAIYACKEFLAFPPQLLEIRML